MISNSNTILLDCAKDKSGAVSQNFVEQVIRNNSKFTASFIKGINICMGLIIIFILVKGIEHCIYVNKNIAINIHESAIQEVLAKIEKEEKVTNKELQISLMSWETK